MDYVHIGNVESEDLEKGEKNEKNIAIDFETVEEHNEGWLEKREDDLVDLNGSKSDQYLCYICYDKVNISDAFTLQECGHQFCRGCLIDFLHSKILEAQVHPKCFHPVDPEEEGRSQDKFESFEVGDLSADDVTLREGNSNKNVNNEYENQTGNPERRNWFRQFLLSLLPPPPPDETSAFNLQNRRRERGGRSSATKSKTCDKVIQPETIRSLLSSTSLHPDNDNAKMLERFERFLFVKAHPLARECPHCLYLQIGSEDESARAMVCEKCHYNYCFLHGGAHEGKTCEDYLALVEAEFKQSLEAIATQCKPCPKCKTPIAKTQGCNHMKCPQCDAAFCWLCGEEVDDSVFPTHFQWWTGGKCANLQMNEAIEPSQTVRRIARISSFFEIIFIGPITLVSTIVSLCACCPCILPSILGCGRKEKEKENTCFERFTSVFVNCISGWGLFWLTILLWLPLTIVLLSLLAVIFVISTIKFGFVALYRLIRGKSVFSEACWTSFSNSPIASCMFRYCPCFRTCLRANDACLPDPRFSLPLPLPLPLPPPPPPGMPPPVFSSSNLPDPLPLPPHTPPSPPPPPPPLPPLPLQTSQGNLYAASTTTLSIEQSLIQNPAMQVENHQHALDTDTLTTTTEPASLPIL